MTDFITTAQGRRIAYHRSAGQGPGVVFLGGFKSDMTGNKAVHLEAWAQAKGRAFLRFDYSGHGESGGDFLDYCIGDGFADAMAAIDALTTGPQVLVGSSMGGWIALLVARAMPERVAGLVCIAASPDFTEDRLWPSFTAAERAELAQTGKVARPSDYASEPYIFTRKLVEDGRNHLVLRDPLKLPCPVRLLQGTADAQVPVAVALHLMEHAESPDLQLLLVKGADHRFSTPHCLSLVTRAVAEVVESET